MKGEPQTPWIRARVAQRREGGPAIERVGPLTAYLAQTIVDDALAAGTRGEVELEVARIPGTQVPEVLRQPIARLARRGVRVTVRAMANWPPPIAGTGVA